jgi:hypothetical protein
MPSKKAKPEKNADTNRSQSPAVQAQEAAPENRPNDDVRRLLRTAAWSRMFGRTSGDKNPFAR